MNRSRRKPWMTRWICDLLTKVASLLGFHSNRCGRVCFQPVEQILGEIDEPRFAPGGLGRFIWSRDLQYFNQAAGLGGHDKDPVTQINRLLDRGCDEENSGLLFIPEVR